MCSASQGEIGQHDNKVCLEVNASATCSRQVYQVFVSDRDFLTKNISFCFRFSSSLNKAALTKASDTAR